jgi:hypothetical protein
MFYSPARSVWAVVDSPVVRLFTVTLAFATAAPAGFVTEPDRVLKDCASSADEIRNIRHRKTSPEQSFGTLRRIEDS